MYAVVVDANGSQFVVKFKEQVMKEVLIFAVGYLLGIGMAEAQTYVITNPQGYNKGVVQVQGNQAQVVNNAGYVTQSLTIYPNQVVTPTGAALGVSTGYTVPSVPMSPPSPRVMQ
jgi:hypothetical protein